MMHLATDVGGTFTDFVLTANGKLTTFKLPSSASAPHRTIQRGLERIIERESQAQDHEAQGVDADPLKVLSHASTVATNSVLERKGAKVAFVTTQGFRDLLHIGRQDRPRLYDFDARRPEPLVSRHMCFEVYERLGPGGEILIPLDEKEADRIVARAREEGAQALAVCLLHSYADPAHELILARAASIVGLPCSLSSHIWPEYREFERASTTVMDAFLRPVLTDYLRALQGLLEDGQPGAALRLMVSSGTLVPVSADPSRAIPNPVELLLSGPAGGVAAAAQVAARVREPDVITLDMGGTSTDVALLLEGRPTLSSRGTVAGLPVRLPRVAIETVGAGGGSIARVGPDGTLQVGPTSAGARPGPACYGLGGCNFTVTDALLLTGWLPPLELPGKIDLRPELAREAAAPLADQLGLTVERLATGVLEVAMATMLRPLEALTLRQGHDPAALTLMAFGGAGPLLACSLAHRLGCPRVIIPAHAGVFSALGLALSPVSFHRSRALMISTSKGQAALAQAREQLVEALEAKALSHDLNPDSGFWEWDLDCRYQGQSHELGVTFKDPITLPELERAFHKVHHRTNGYDFPDRPVELVALRGSLSFPAPPLEMPVMTGSTTSTLDPTSELVSDPVSDLVSDPAYDLISDSASELSQDLSMAPGRVLWMGQWQDASCYQREALARDQALSGPALVLENGSTTFIPPGWLARVDDWSNLLLEVD